MHDHAMLRRGTQVVCRFTDCTEQLKEPDFPGATLSTLCEPHVHITLTANREGETGAIRGLNRRMPADNRVFVARCPLPLEDGLTIALKLA